jgi:hypothetical protein
MGLLPIIRRIRRPLTLEERPETAKPVALAQAAPEQAPVVVPDLPPAPEVPTEKPRRKRKYETKANEAELQQVRQSSADSAEVSDSPTAGPGDTSSSETLNES